MRKFCLLHKLGLSICVVTVLMCFSSYSEIKAQLSVNDFVVIDRTKVLENNNNSSFQAVGNSYRLTDTFAGQFIQMWHKGHTGNGLSLDLSQEFVLNFSIGFGEGKSGRAANAPIGAGVAFVMHNRPASDTNILIAGLADYSFYYIGRPIQSVVSSFSIEFDTEYDWGYANSASFEGWYPTGWPLNGRPITDDDCHIAYVSGNTALSYLPGPMLDNWQSVKGKKLCVSIQWKFRNGVDGTGGYDLTTYITDDLPYGKLVKRYYQGLPNGLFNGNSVTWGITSATGYNPNRHTIDFYGLYTGVAAKAYFPTISAISVVSNNLAIPLFYSEVAPNCNSSNPPPVFPADSTFTYYQKLCFEEDKSYNLEFTNINMAGANWSIDGNSVTQKAFEDENGKWIFLLADLQEYFEGKSEATVKAQLPDNRIINFHFTSIGNNDNFFRKLEESLMNQNIEVEGNVGTMLVESGRLYEIYLPEDCSYRFDFDSFGDEFDEIGRIPYRYDALQFVLAEGVCEEIEIPITFLCECRGEFIFKIKNEDCEDCEGVEVSDGMWIAPNYKPDLVLVDSVVSLLDLTSSFDIFSYYSSFSEITYSYPSHKTVSSVVATPLAPGDPWHISISTDGSIMITNLCKGSPCALSLLDLPTESTWRSYKMEVCITFTDGTYCCDTVEVNEVCSPPHWWFPIKSVRIFPIPVLENIINISYELNEFPELENAEDPSPLNIAIYDQFGIKKMDVMNEIPTKLSDTLNPNITSLQVGHYYVSFPNG